MSSAPQLNYAPHTPAHKRLSRWIIIASILLACIASSLWWLPTEWRRIQLLYWQQQCLAYTTAADQVVFDPKSSGPPKCPQEWTKFYSIYSPPGFRSVGTLFLHELHRPDGQRRLVALDLDSRDPVVSVVFPRVFVPGNLLQSAYETSSVSSSYEIPVPSAIIFAGMPDPADPTHFTFKAQLNATVVIFDGWLGNDDRITIGQRKIVTGPK
jgi:hypothetical protein